IWVMIPWAKKQREKLVLVRASAIESKVSFRAVLQSKSAWIFILIRFLLDTVFYFLMFWVPKYLNEERGLSFERIGELFWIPFLALGISNILGGWFSDKLIKRTLSVNAARKWIMGIAAVITLVAPFISRV